MFLGGPERMATGSEGSAILTGLGVEVNAKLNKCFALGKVLRLLRKFMRSLGTMAGE
jgi:hypothetical protein